MEISAMIKKFFSRFSNEYAQTFQKTRLISQIPLFVIAIINFMEILRIIQAISQTENVSWEAVKAAIVFPILIGAIFFSRFLLLFSVAKTSFWISQILWLFSLITIHFFLADFQNHCLDVTSLIYAIYILGSPLHQFIILLFSINKVLTR
jgi:hypothetical protein